MKAKTTKSDRTPAKPAKAKSVRFCYAGGADAKRVFIAGDFNAWDPEVDRMLRRDGAFIKKLKLEPGEHEYKFVVDGRWVADPMAEAWTWNSAGSQNSVVRV